MREVVRQLVDEDWAIGAALNACSFEVLGAKVAPFVCRERQHPIRITSDLARERRQVGAFGGSMIGGLTAELGMADSSVKLLVQADFEKMCALANRFDRPEVRMLAKMIVLRAVLDEKKSTENIDADY